MAETVKISQICEIAKGKKVKISETKNKNSIPYLLIDTLRGDPPKYFTEDEKYTEANENDILMVFDGANSGLTGTGLNGAVGSTIARLRFDNSVISKYLSYFLFSNFQFLNKDMKGSAIPHVKPKKLLNLEIRLPEKEEQQLIVDEIEKQLTRLDATIIRLKFLKNKLKVYRKILLKKLFIKGKDWEEGPLETFCEKITDGSHYTPRYFNEGYPFISIKNRKEGKLNFEGCNLISSEDFKKLKQNDCNPLNGDILFSKDGTVGEVIKIDYDKEFIVLSSWAIVRPKKVLSQDLLYWIMRSTETLNQATKLKTGTAIRRIILRNLKTVNIKFPKSLEEQQKIVEEIESKFSIIDNVERVVDESLFKSEQLRKSILKKAFEGELVKHMEIKQ